MRSIFYLLRTILKNMLRQLLRKPAQLIAYLVFGGLMVFSALNSGGERGEGGQAMLAAAAPYFFAIVFALFLFISFLTINKGLKQGSTFFSMSDVNFMFTSPIRPQTVLIYGMIRQLGLSLLMTLFMCFQIPNLINFFGLDAMGIFAMLSGWFFLVMSVQASTLCIYSLTAPVPSRRSVGKYILYGLAVVLGLGFIAFLALQKGDYTKIPEFFQLPIVGFFPFAGWLMGYVRYLIEGNVLLALLHLTPALLFPAIGLVLVRRTESDYYEDVLSITEISHATRTAIKDGKPAFTQNLGDVKTGKSGLVGRGRGASAIFFRHLTEQRRTGLYLVDKMSILAVGAAVVAGFIFRFIINAGEMEPFLAEVIGVAALAYLLYFTSIMGKFTQELTKPFIYIIPASNFSKLFFSNLATVVKAAIEGLVAFSILAVMIGSDPWYPICATLVYAAMSQIYISMTILTQRILGDTKSKFLNAIVYLVCGGILLAPGIAVFSVSLYFLHTLMPALIFLAYLAAFVYATLISLLILFLGRGVLQAGDV